MPTRSSFSVFRILEVALVISLLNTNSVASRKSIAATVHNQGLDRFPIFKSRILVDQSGPPDRFDSLPRSSMGISDNGEGSGGDYYHQSTIWLVDQRAISDFVKEK